MKQTIESARKNFEFVRVWRKNPKNGWWEDEAEVILMYESETMVWKEKRSWIKDLQLDNLRGLLGIRRIDRIPNPLDIKLCRVEERIEDCVLQLFGYIERRENAIFLKGYTKEIA